MQTLTRYALGENDEYITYPTTSTPNRIASQTVFFTRKNSPFCGISRIAGPPVEQRSTRSIAPAGTPAPCAGWLPTDRHPLALRPAARAQFRRSDSARADLPPSGAYTALPAPPCRRP